MSFQLLYRQNAGQKNLMRLLFHRHQRIEFPVLSFYDNKSSDLEVFVNVER